MRRSATWVLLAAALAVMVSACGGRRGPALTLPFNASGANSLRVGLPQGGGYRVVTIPLEEYVAGAALAEVFVNSLPPETASRVLEVQTLLARTYAVANPGRHAADGFDLCSTTHCQLYKPTTTWPERLRDLAAMAARRNEGRLILHDGQPIQALYHSDCGGHTSAAHDVWHGPSRPYLQPVTDAFCRRPASEWQWKVRATDLRRALDENPAVRIDGRLDRISIVDRDVAGRAERLALGNRGRVVMASAFRGAVLANFGARSLRSTRFTVERDGDSFVFLGRGNGHGAGLCQIGTMGRAADGQSAAEILRHYFPGVRIAEWSTRNAARRARTADADGTH